MIVLILFLILVSLVGWMANSCIHVLCYMNNREIAKINSKERMFFWYLPWIPIVYFIIMNIKNQVIKFKNLR